MRNNLNTETRLKCVLFQMSNKLVLKNNSLVLYETNDSVIALLNGTINRSPHENNLTIALISIHYQSTLQYITEYDSPGVLLFHGIPRIQVLKLDLNIFFMIYCHKIVANVFV